MFDPDIAYAVEENPGTAFPFIVLDKNNIPLGYQSKAYIERYQIEVRHKREGVIL